MPCTVSRFNLIANEFTTAESEIIAKKRKRYANNDNVLLNLEQVAELAGVSAALVCYILLLKHVQAIGNALATGEWCDAWGWELPNGMEGLKQHFADARNYLLLLAACLDSVETEEEANGGV